MSMFIQQDDQKKKLANMILPELQDLLQRQQKLVANKSFVRKLPDKGAKITAYIDHIKDEIKMREKVDETADLFEKMALDADTSRRRVVEGDEDSEILNAIVNRPVQEKVFIDEREENLHLPDSYIRVIKEPHKEAIVKERFKPNSNKTKPQRSTPEKKKTQHKIDTESEAIKSLPSSGENHQHRTSDMDTGSLSSVNPKLKHRYDDSLEADMRVGPGVHEKTKMISLEESVSLLRDQKQKQEEYQKHQAMERLAQRLGVRIGTFDPEGSRKMAYREKEASDSDDDDDGDEGEKDYPDEPQSHSTNRPLSPHTIRQSTLSSQPVTR